MLTEQPNTMLHNTRQFYFKNQFWFSTCIQRKSMFNDEFQHHCIYDKWKSWILKKLKKRCNQPVSQPGKKYTNPYFNFTISKSIVSHIADMYYCWRGKILLTCRLNIPKRDQMDSWIPGLNLLYMQKFGGKFVKNTKNSLKPKPFKQLGASRRHQMTRNIFENKIWSTWADTSG